MARATNEKVTNVIVMQGFLEMEAKINAGLEKLAPLASKAFVRLFLCRRIVFVSGTDDHTL